METKITAGQLKCVRTLISKLKIEDVDALALGFSNMRTTHTSELTVPEATGLIKHLQGLDPEAAADDKRRKKLFGMAYDYHGLGRNAGQGEKQAVQRSVKSWVLQYGKKDKNGNHKELDAYKGKELSILLAQFGKLYEEFLKAV